MHTKSLIIFALLASVSADFIFDKLRNNNHDYYHSCDYVVVGIGGGGGVAAGRLAEGMPNKRICAVERGPDYLTSPGAELAATVDNLVELSRSHIFSSRILSVPQLGLLNTTTFGPRPLEDWVGNATGGGGTVNSMGYRRPQKYVFDNLNQAGWSYPEVTAAFLEIESRVGISESSPTFGPIQSLMSSAFNKSGYPLREDPLSNMFGHWQSYWTSVDGYRTSSYLNYTLPNIGNGVDLFPSVRISRVFKIPTLRGDRYIGAIGRDTTNGKIVLFGASRRILLAGGVYRNPQIMLLSGIGNNLPVGQNFWTHTNLQTIHEPNSTYITGFDQTTNRKNNMFGATSEHIIGLSTIYIEEFSPLFPIGFSEIITTNVSSRGVITLNSTNPDAQPVVDHRLFSHPDDIEAVKRTFAAFRQVMAQPEALLAYPQEIAPGPQVPSDSEFYIRAAAGIAHVGGGCHIGSVVDNSLRVYGTRNLHVCDMSVYPSPVGVNTYSTAMLAGYQCSRFILEEDA
nr:glucose-methanol-choline oxidoreductase [Kaumoebavirus]